MNEALYGLRESVTATPNKLEVFTDGFHAAVSPQAHKHGQMCLGNWERSLQLGWAAAPTLVVPVGKCCMVASWI